MGNLCFAPPWPPKGAVEFTNNAAAPKNFTRIYHFQGKWMNDVIHTPSIVDLSTRFWIFARLPFHGFFALYWGLFCTLFWVEELSLSFYLELFFQLQPIGSISTPKRVLFSSHFVVFSHRFSPVFPALSKKSTVGAQIDADIEGVAFFFQTGWVLSMNFCIIWSFYCYITLSSCECIFKFEIHRVKAPNTTLAWLFAILNTKKKIG